MRNLAVQAKAITGSLTAAIGAAAAVVTALNMHAAWVPVLIAAATALGVYGGVYHAPYKPGETVPSAPPQADMNAVVNALESEARWIEARRRGGYTGGAAAEDMKPPLDVPSGAVLPKPPATGETP